MPDRALSESKRCQTPEDAAASPAEADSPATPVGGITMHLALSICGRWLAASRE